MNITTPLPGIDEPPSVKADLEWVISRTVLDHPRSRQQIIGPSELGMPCTRALLHKLNQDGDPAPAPGTWPQLPWLATVGTAVHAWLAAAFTDAMIQRLAEPRYLIEHRVNVGTIAGLDIWGSCDLFDIPPGAVVDWKIVGDTTLRRVRAANSPGPQYRSQAHAYGRGLVRAGFPVNTVMIFFVPRNGQFSGRFVWSEPYDEAVALQALARCQGLFDLITAVGIDAAVSLYPPCTSTWCDWCSNLTTKGH